MCKHPMKGFQIGYHPSGKPEYKIVSYSVDHVEYNGSTWIPAFTSFRSPYAQKVVSDFVEIPCNHCADCLLKHARDWANRCLMEASFYKPCECWFLTLTYDNAHIMTSINEYGLLDATLYKEDLQRFWKRLRRYMEYHNLPARIRYFACGEYGTTTFRPHYHAILFGCPCIDLVPWEMSKSGCRLFRSPVLEKLWGNGMVCASPVSWNAACYTARYCLKKKDGFDRQMYLDLGLEPEYIVMSRRPGIGRDYYEMHKNHIYEFDEIILDGDKEAIRAKPPKYFDELFEAEDPAAYEKIKEERIQTGKQATFLKMSRTDLSYLEQLQVEENQLLQRLKGLYRNSL